MELPGRCGRWLETATVTAQGTRSGSTRRARGTDAKITPGDHHTATRGDFYLATSGDFVMATDNGARSGAQAFALSILFVVFFASGTLLVRGQYVAGLTGSPRHPSVQLYWLGFAVLAGACVLGIVTQRLGVILFAVFVAYLVAASLVSVCRAKISAAADRTKAFRGV